MWKFMDRMFVYNNPQSRHVNVLSKYTCIPIGPLDEKNTRGRFISYKSHPIVAGLKKDNRCYAPLAL